MTTYTIGHTKTPAREFFGKLSNAGVRRVIDVRLKNTSALAGYARKDDLAYFLEAFAGIHYVHAPELSPDEELFTDYKKNGLPWDDYEPRFLSLMASREIEKKIDPALLENTCLLCAEKTPHECHRRLVLEYLQYKWGTSLDVVHL
tara:strand:+ start:924 stop:1361 length:438 start_codon:yes stop_codon:yes gene_type:complete